MPFLQPHLSILPVAQQQLWPELRPSVALGLVLYGGTAIGLRLGHRPSVDFDFFTDRPLERQSLESVLPFLAGSRTIQDQPNCLIVLAGAENPVKISFFGGLDFGRIGEPELTSDAILQVASLEDLMAMKLKVLLQRVEAKDYRDIAAMLDAGVSLALGLAGASMMFGPSFQPAECLKALTYFEGGDLQTLSHRERDVLVRGSKSVRDLPDVVLKTGLSAS